MAAFFGRTKADVYIYLFMIVYVVAAYACRAYLPCLLGRWDCFGELTIGLL